MEGNSLLVVLLVIVILLLIIFFVWWRMFFGFRGTAQPADFGTVPQPTETASPAGKVDPALVGTWESECLVPDLNSPWSEKHQFIINADGTAQHTRWSSSGHSCAPETTMVDKYTISTPSSGKVEFNLQEGTGPIGEDIYQVSGSALMFGHGFRGDHMPYTAETLNQYIVYKKK